MDSATTLLSMDIASDGRKMLTNCFLILSSSILEAGLILEIKRSISTSHPPYIWVVSPTWARESLACKTTSWGKGGGGVR